MQTVVNVTDIYGRLQNPTICSKPFWSDKETE
jgi:hypothetical protein